MEHRELPHIAGLVFVDFNQDGAQDPDEPGVPGVIVRVTNSAGAIASATTADDGTYNVEVDDAMARVEFTNLPADTRPGRITGDSGATVRFVNSAQGATDINLGLSVPLLATTQFNYDSAIDGANTGAPAVVEIPYGSTDSPTPVVLATMADVGSTWGLAYQSSSDSLFTSAFVKRHAGLGPNASGAPTTGGIWRIDRTTGDVTLLIDLNAAGAAFNAGANPHPTSAEAAGGDWFHDAATFGLVGKRGLGGLAVSADGRTLYTVNLNTRQLVEIPLNADGARDTGRQLRGTTIPLTNPTGSGIGSFNAGDLRPFAVAVGPNGTIFVGVTYTAETSGNRNDLRAFVYTFNPSAGTFSAAPVLTANLSYTRGIVDDPNPDIAGDEVSADWRAWSGNFANVTGPAEFPVLPQPWLTDIAFDGSNMVLGLRDRFGDQSGFQTGNTTPDADPSDDPQFTGIAAGEMLRAAPNGSGGWTLESNGSSGGVSTDGAGNGQGPGGGEFYFGQGAISTRQHVTSGGLAQVPGFTTIAVTGSDPLAAFTGGVYTFNNSDPPPAESTNPIGRVKAAAQLVETFDQSTFGSANELGDLAVVPAAGIQAGDRVFADSNRNGIQDAGEGGIPGVVVRLFQAGNAVDSVTTGAGGDFVFDDLLPNTAYELRIDTTQPAVGNRRLAPANQGTNDQLDSDATLTSTTAAVAFTTGPDGTVNHALDIGFGGVTTQANGLEVGDTVFRDVNNNGKLDSGETGIQGVTVELLHGTGATVISTTTTDASGHYSFTGLTAGDYIVQLPASNFQSGGALVGFSAGTTVAADPNNDVDNDNNGALNGTLGTGGTIRSGIITLSTGGEPITDGDSDPNTNFTLDFGVVPPGTTGTLSLGNQVFNDANNNGTRDTGENGIAGVTVRLFAAGDVSTPVATTTTDSQGLYVFRNLAAGDYIVELADVNFMAGGVLVGFTSSTGTANAFEPAPDPDTAATDGDDNGTTTGTLGQAGGVIRSAAVTLAAGSEPTGETPNNDSTTDADSNLTVDFGVLQQSQPNTLTLGDRVFRDNNNNGTLDTGETGIGGVTVQLLDSTATIARSTVTDSAGLYRFANLAAGNYQVRLAASNFESGGVLVGFTSSTGVNNAFEGGNTPDPDNNINNDDNGTTSGTLGQANGIIESKAITLALGTEPTNDGDADNNTNLTLDFGLVAPAVTLTVGNTVFKDVNNNGRFDAGELGVPGVTVELVNAAGAVVGTTTTNTSGQYTFTGLAAGDYRVRLASTNFRGGGPLVGFTSSTGGSSEPAPDPDNDVDNDDNGQVSGTLGGTGVIQTGLFTLAAGAEPTNDGDTDPNTNMTVDIGVFQPFSVGNVVFNDLNNNGTQDAGENGIPNVVVRLLNAGDSSQVATTTTNAQGQYLFSNLAAGSYIAELAASNFNTGGPLFAFQSSTGTNNAFEPAPANTTDKNDDGTTSGTLGSGGVIRSGSITLGPGMPTLENPNNDANTPDNQSNLTVDFGVFQLTPSQASLTGRVFLDFNNSGAFNGPDTGIQGVTITLSGGNLSAPITVQTDTQGNFSFSNLAAGTYTLTETQPTAPANQTGRDTPGTAGGTVSSPNTIADIVLGASTHATGYNFAEVPIVSTGGSVYEDLNGNGKKDAGETGIAGVTLTLTGTSVVTGTITPRTVQTDAQGNYTFESLTPGNYNIAETQPTGFIDGQEQNGTPAAASVTNDKFGGINLANSAAVSTGFNFGEIKASGIAGVVFDDTDGDGTQDAGEAGIAGVKVKLTGINDKNQVVSLTATTAADGSYSFTALRPGIYQLTETQPVGYKDGADKPGTSGGNATTNDMISNIQLASGASATGYLFAEQSAADLAMSITPTSTQVLPGGTVVLTFTVRNKGRAAATAAEATLNLGGLTFVSANSPDYDNTTHKWTIGDLAAGATETLRVTLRAGSAGTFAPSATVTTTTPESVTTNNTGRATIVSGTGMVSTTSTSFTPSHLWFLTSFYPNLVRRPR